MNEPPVVRNKNWRFLIRDLERRPQLAFLRDVPRPPLQYALWPAVAIARWISTQMPDLQEAQRLHILVAGCEYADCIDDGMWFSLLPVLLGRDGLKIDVDLVGPHYGEREVRRRMYERVELQTPAFGTLPMRSHVHRTTLEDYLERAAPRHIDVAFVFHPGLESFRDDWMQGGGLQRLVHTGIPVVGASYASDDCAMDQLTLEAFGFEGVGQPVENPFFFDPDNDRRSMKAFLLWSMGQQAPVPPRVVDQGLLTAVDKLIGIRNTNDLHSLNYATSHYLLRTEIDEPEPMVLIHLPWGVLVNAETGSVFCNDAMFGAATEVESTKFSKEDLASCPPHESTWSDKLRWLARVIARYDLSEDFAKKHLGLGEGAEALMELLRENKEFTGDMLDNLEEIFGLKRVEVREEWQPLIEAMARSDSNRVLALVESDNTLVNARNEKGVSPAYWAVMRGDEADLARLVELGCDVNHKDCEGWPMLVEAVRRESTACLRILLSLPELDVNAYSPLGWTALHMAAQRGKREAATLLLNAGADPYLANSMDVTAADFIRAQGWHGVLEGRGRA